ncbi:hypothetical protein MU0083_001724 [[Mycobacterium] kokjensenii]|uniref:Uncharacterized protein n=1 Tax=[Mycobacterium] kokjensenii TaxID=3064287 RepID=A0ABM9LEJ6_9MYCO|nr:hypothetical protein [Mycolicibacter sp. MU0083]CAJ1497633.1 hypothetical protein MU0083_001724 [Mycolicibacter sp. MU0083]
MRTTVAIRPGVPRSTALVAGGRTALVAGSPSLLRATMAACVFTSRLTPLTICSVVGH